MNSVKTVDVFMGTRPEAIKMAPVVAAFGKSPGLRCRVVATGQHREMFQQVAEQFGFTADVDLAAMQPRQTLAGLTARLMERIDGWLEAGHPDMALVQGDTTTVLVAALACLSAHSDWACRGRSANRDIWAPFPEEAIAGQRRRSSRCTSPHSVRQGAAAEGVSADTSR
jgi:UDP-N-acetylglucosamine 2-epimerase (non-hydrolysing)